MRLESTWANTAVRTANLLRNTARCCVSGGGHPPAKALALWLARAHTVQNNSLLLPCYAACPVLPCRRCSRLVCWTRCASGFVICITAYVPSRPTSIGFGSPDVVTALRDQSRRRGRALSLAPARPQSASSSGSQPGGESGSLARFSSGSRKARASSMNCSALTGGTSRSAGGPSVLR